MEDVINCFRLFLSSCVTSGLPFTVSPRRDCHAFLTCVTGIREDWKYGPVRCVFIRMLYRSPDVCVDNEQTGSSSLTPQTLHSPMSPWPAQILGTHATPSVVMPFLTSDIEEPSCCSIDKNLVSRCFTRYVHTNLFQKSSDICFTYSLENHLQLLVYSTSCPHRFSGSVSCKPRQATTLLSIISHRKTIQ